MNRRAKRNAQKTLDRVSKHYSDKFIQIMPEEWPSLPKEYAQRIYVFRNNRFLVQVFKENTSLRISVNRTELDKNGRWKDDISWDEMQDIKNRIGYHDCMFVEIYPRDVDVVNVANMRHLWMVDHNTNIGWKR